MIHLHQLTAGTKNQATWGITNNMMRLGLSKTWGEFQIEGGQRWSMIGLLSTTPFISGLDTVLRSGSSSTNTIFRTFFRTHEPWGFHHMRKAFQNGLNIPKYPECSIMSITGSTFEPTGQGHWCSPELWRTSVKASGFWCWCFLVSLNVERCWKNREYHENIWIWGTNLMKIDEVCSEFAIRVQSTACELWSWRGEEHPEMKGWDLKLWRHMTWRRGDSHGITHRSHAIDVLGGGDKRYLFLPAADEKKFPP